MDPQLDLFASSPPDTGRHPTVTGAEWGDLPVEVQAAIMDSLDWLLSGHAGRSVPLTLTGTDCGWTWTFRAEVGDFPEVGKEPVEWSDLGRD